MSVPEHAQALELAIREKRSRAEVDRHLHVFENCLVELIGALDHSLAPSPSAAMH